MRRHTVILNPFRSTFSFSREQLPSALRAISSRSTLSHRVRYGQQDSSPATQQVTSALHLLSSRCVAPVVHLTSPCGRPSWHPMEQAIGHDG